VVNFVSPIQECTADQEDHFGDKKCPFLGFYAASSGNFLPTFRDNPLVVYSRAKNPKRILDLEDGTDNCPETSVRN
jgi:hypothetical protein